MGKSTYFLGVPPLVSSSVSQSVCECLCLCVNGEYGCVCKCVCVFFLLVYFFLCVGLLNFCDSLFWGSIPGVGLVPCFWIGLKYRFMEVGMLGYPLMFQVIVFLFFVPDVFCVFPGEDLFKKKIKQKIFFFLI